MGVLHSSDVKDRDAAMLKVRRPCHSVGHDCEAAAAALVAHVPACCPRYQPHTLLRCLHPQHMAPTLQTLGLTKSEAKRLFHAFNCVDKDGSGQVRLYNRRATVLCGEHGP